MNRLQRFAILVSLLGLATSATSGELNRFCRHLGFGMSDGYHAAAIYGCCPNHSCNGACIPFAPPVAVPMAPATQEEIPAPQQEFTAPQAPTPTSRESSMNESGNRTESANTHPAVIRLPAVAPFETRQLRPGSSELLLR